MEERQIVLICLSFDPEFKYIQKTNQKLITINTIVFIFCLFLNSFKCFKVNHSTSGPTKFGDVNGSVSAL